ncbi:MAG: transporter substrate-binding domain-containing protein [Chloroflexi bacterium]|nr:transporter substrate-binding domain-containing protein [Chloroflexota bacterium]
MRYHHFLLLGFVLLLLSCTNSGSRLRATPTPEILPTLAPTPTPTPRIPGAHGTFNRILQRQSLIIGLIADPAAPFVQGDSDTALDGLDILLADALARQWIGRANALAWRTQATPADLAAGRVDLLMGGLVHTRADEAEIDFSQTYWYVNDQPIAIGLPANDSLIRDLVNLGLQNLVLDGQWDEIVRATTGAAPDFIPELWQPPLPAITELVSHSPASSQTSRLQPGTPLRIAYQNEPGFVLSPDTEPPKGYLPDLARELSRRLTGSSQPLLLSYPRQPGLTFHAFDIYLGPIAHAWSLESEADFSQTYYGDGLVLIARPGSNVTKLAQLDRRPLALIQTPTSLELYNAAISQLGIEPILFPVDDTETALALLEDSKIDAILLQGYPAARLLAARIPDAYLAAGRQGKTIPMAIALPPNDSTLRDAVNLALQDMASDGFLANLHSKYFGGDPPYPIEHWPLR